LSFWPLKSSAAWPSIDEKSKFKIYKLKVRICSFIALGVGHLAYLNF
jgi:hypothetical protein